MLLVSSWCTTIARSHRHLSVKLLFRETEGLKRGTSPVLTGLVVRNWDGKFRKGVPRRQTAINAVPS
jgi:hypothetical protein